MSRGLGPMQIRVLRALAEAKPMRLLWHTDEEMTAEGELAHYEMKARVFGRRESRGTKAAAIDCKPYETSNLNRALASLYSRRLISWRRVNMYRRCSSFGVYGITPAGRQALQTLGGLSEYVARRGGEVFT